MYLKFFVTDNSTNVYTQTFVTSPKNPKLVILDHIPCGKKNFSYSFLIDKDRKKKNICASEIACTDIFGNALLCLCKVDLKGHLAWYPLDDNLIREFLNYILDYEILSDARVISIIWSKLLCRKKMTDRVA